MYDIPTYNHSPRESEPSSGPSFFHFAAKASLFAPIFLVVFLAAVEHGLKDEKAPWVRLVTAGLGIVTAFLLVACLALAIIALAGIPRHGKQGILGRAIAGIFVNIVLLGIWAGGFVHGFQSALQNRAAAKSVARESTELTESMKRELDEKGTITPESGQANVAKIKAVFDKASKEMTGDDALIAKAGSAYMAKAQALLADYTSAMTRLKSQSVLNMREVNGREQLQTRKDLVKKFMIANEKLIAFFSNAEDILKNEMARLQVSPAAADSALAGYRRTATERNALAIKIRETDERIGTAMLNMLNLLDTNWGNWSYNTTKKNVTFKDHAAVVKYNEYYNDMEAAATEQDELQARLVNLPTVASAR